VSILEVTVGTTPILVCSVPPGGVTIQNTGLEKVFLGGPAVSEFSEPLAAGASTVITGNWLVDVLLLAGSELYAITATATTTLMVQNATPTPRPPWPHPRPHRGR